MVYFTAGFDTLASLLSQSDMPLFRAEEAKVCCFLFFQQIVVKLPVKVSVGFY